MDNCRQSTSEERDYQEMRYRAEQEAKAAWLQSEEYRARQAKDAALIRALTHSPSTPVKKNVESYVSQDELYNKSFRPITPSSKIPFPPKEHSREHPFHSHSPSSSERSFGSDGLLLVTILFFLWREKAEKEILFALLYILLT